MVASAVTGAAAGSAAAPVSSAPETLCTTPDSISVAYFAGQTESEREAALAVVANHCGGSYMETRTVNRGAWRVVDARCVPLAVDGSRSAPCVYDGTTPDGFGEVGEDSR